MSEKNILKELYKARITKGRWQFAEKKPIYPEVSVDGRIDTSISRIDSVQIDLHPDQYKKLLDQITYLHNDKGAVRGKSILSDMVVDEMYQAEREEKELRERHPMLKQYWQRYQSLKAIIEADEK